ncbi:MAG: hypothetical protein HY610_03050, partial [Elusimicrobia bacterium]|nr:hypothetical protein [Elusimicrobiota bacterium]
MKKLFEKLIRIFWGVILIPFTLATFYHIPSLLFSLNHRVDSLMFLFAGAVIYLVLEGVLHRPLR